MKRKLFVTLLLLMLFTGVSTVHADMGPKPSLNVTIKGVTEEYSFDVLIYNDDKELPSEIEPYNYYKEIPDALIGYKDIDGYYSYGIYETPAIIKQTKNEMNQQEYLLNYYRPNHLKLVLVLDGTNEIISSRAIDVVGFEAEMVWDLTGVNLSGALYEDVGLLTGDIDGEIPFLDSIGFSSIVNTLIRMLITITVELGILLLFGIRTKKAIRLIIIVNAITNLLLGGVLICIYQTSGPLAFYFMTVFVEIIVFITELVIYSVKLKEIPFWKILTYTFVANLITFIIGLRFIIII